MTEGKRFQKNDAGFICAHCGRKVPPLEVTSRDHCPHCLYSLHVDEFPGDRQNPCRGVLRPVSAQPHAKKGYVILYRCEKCGKLVRNKAALAGNVPDESKSLCNPNGEGIEYCSRKPECGSYETQT